MMTTSTTLSTGKHRHVKKIIIKNYQAKPTLPAHYERDTWLMLKEAVQAIHRQENSAQSHETLYRSVEMMCRHGFAATLYSRLQTEVEMHVIRAAQTLRDALDQVSNEENVLLKEIHALWQRFREQLMLIRNIFLYLDRTYVLRTPGIDSIWDMGLALFREHVYTEHPTLRDNLVSGLLVMVEHQRRQEPFDVTLLHSLLRQLYTLSPTLYHETFQRSMLSATARYYDQLAREKLSFLPTSSSSAHTFNVSGATSEENDVAERVIAYLGFVKECFDQEHSVSWHFLSDTSSTTDSMTDSTAVTANELTSARHLIMPIVERSLMQRHTDTIIRHAFAFMIRERRYPALRLLYVLCCRVDLVSSLKDALCQYIKTYGETMVMDPAKDSTMVEGLLSCKADMDAVVTDGFQLAPTPSEADTAISEGEQENKTHFAMMVNGIRDAFEYFINKRTNKPAEMIAKFVDTYLRKWNTSASQKRASSTTPNASTDAELEKLMEEIFVLFRFIQGKDIFEAFYKKDLARRLLLGKSASFDAEKLVLSKLKTECGPGFTSKLEGMFRDIEISREVMLSYKETSRYHKYTKGVLGVDMVITVLTEGFWPSYPKCEAILPSFMMKGMNHFTNFYTSKHDGRQLTWQHSLGTCILRVQCPKLMVGASRSPEDMEIDEDPGHASKRGLRELIVSTYQTIILLLFNDAETLSYEDISKATNIEQVELKKALQSLACGKYRVLTKTPMSRDIDEEDCFGFNAEFAPAVYRTKINAIQVRETPEEQSFTTEQVFQDRQYQVDAAIVRVLKGRKKLSHADLMHDLQPMLPFPYKSSDIKKRVETLINREYMERDEANSNFYHYVA